MPEDRRATAAGFSLVEALIASLLVASAIVGLAHLVAIGAEQSLGSRRAASTLTIAQSKLEQLHQLQFAYGVDGSRLSNAGLGISPTQALQEDTPGYVDHVDGFGAVVPVDGSAVPDYVRRWAIAALEAGDQDTLVLHVCVFVARGPDVREVMPAACSSGIRTRKP